MNIPIFKNTHEAIQFSKTISKSDIKFLKLEREKLLRLSDKYLAEADINNYRIKELEQKAINCIFQAQFIRECFESVKI